MVGLLLFSIETRGCVFHTLVALDFYVASRVPCGHDLGELHHIATRSPDIQIVGEAAAEWIHIAPAFTQQAGAVADALFSSLLFATHCGAITPSLISTIYRRRSRGYF